MTTAETWPRWLVQLEDEAPSIGSGWRAIHVKIGRKWVRLFDDCTDRRVRIPLGKWRAIAANAKPLPSKKKRRQSASTLHRRSA